jgi:type IV secretion system T-DNA border endonuclease VirD2
MARSEGARQIIGALFENGWSDLIGRANLSRPKQMSRAASGHTPAIFKAIKRGGCSTRSDLKGQLTYLTTKASHVIDSRGEFSRAGALGEKEIDKLVKRFASRWDERFTPKMGNTTHLLMAFPIGTKGQDVREMVGELCERFFQGEKSHFDYVAAVHEDRDHPHAHVVLNRRSKDGEMFYLGEDHRFNYDAFREAMVEIGAKYRIRLEATKRLDRGVLTYKAPIAEIYKAKDEGRAPVERQRVGKSLDVALAEVARASRTYSDLSAEATAENRQDLAEALFEASAILARGEALKPDGVIYMAEADRYEDIASDFRGRVQSIEEMAAQMPPDRRASVEKELNDVLRSVSHLGPLGLHSETLRQDASNAGIYSARNIDQTQIGRLKDNQTRAEIDTALRGTGISSGQVISRMQIGAENAALERRWLADDLKAIAAEEELDLDIPAERLKAAELLDQTHVKLGEALSRVPILRDSGVRDEGHAARAEGQGAETVSSEGVSHRPRIAEVLAAMRLSVNAEPLKDDRARLEFREEIETELDDEALDRLEKGDADALREIAEDRLDRLYLAKAYLHSHEATATGPVMEGVKAAISEERVEAERLRDLDSEKHKGPRHG